MNEKPPVIPINFRLTASAASEISTLTQKGSREEGDVLIPVIGWAEEYEESERRLVERGIYLGWFKESEVPIEQIQSVDGVRLIFGVWPKQAHKFEGRSINFSNGRFDFAEKGRD
jgi:hypothetical protein